MSSHSHKHSGLNVKRVLGQALPAKLSTGKAKNASYQPLPGEPPLVVLRVQVISCKDLLSKDKNGKSDPFVRLGLLACREQTPVVNATLNPKYLASEATFHFPLYLSLADRIAALELVVWDQDKFNKDYLGEVALPVEDWFDSANPAGMEWRDDGPERSLSLISTRAKTPSKGSVQLRLGFVRPAAQDATSDGPSGAHVDPNTPFEAIYEELLGKRGDDIRSIAPTMTIGTIPSSPTSFERPYELTTDDESDSDDDTTDLDAAEETEHRDNSPSIDIPSLPLRLSEEPLDTDEEKTPLATVPPQRLDVPATLDDKPSKGLRPALRQAGSNISSKSAKLVPKVFRKSSTLSVHDGEDLSRADASSGVSNSSVSTSTLGSSDLQTSKASQSQSSTTGFQLGGDHDIVGVVMLEIQEAKDLPRIRNMLRTGWDMDPFVVISFGKKVFRTRVIRHSRDPVWDEKLLFHVKRFETNFDVKFQVLDWDKISTHDYVGEATFNVGELIGDADKDERGVYQGDLADKDERKYDLPRDEEMRQFNLSLTAGSNTSSERPWESKHQPILTFRARYQPYSALRRRFWSEYLKQYDVDDTMTLSHLELTTMLDSLGSTLSDTTVDGFWSRFNKNPAKDDLSIPESIECLEDMVAKPPKQRRRTDDRDYHAVDSAAPSGARTPLSGADDIKQTVGLENGQAPIDFSGPPGTRGRAYPTEPSTMLVQSAEGIESTSGLALSQRSTSHSSESSSDNSDAFDEGIERVINIKTCPLCHKPRMRRRGEVDIVTHMALCASQDWARVDKIVVGNFVTSSQAQRKWYTKWISKVSAGSYRIGANSANIIVQNRTTGQLEEEKMQVYVRLGIRLLYKGAKSKMEGARARNLLKSLSVKQGKKYDDPASAADIVPFINFHHLNVDEILDPVESYKTFNEFFHRKLKPDARPVDAPQDPTCLVSAADCRMMAFATVGEATTLWIKGREFTVAKLLGLDATEAGRSQASRYDGGALAVFRLAPQDYHRFHSPVDGKIGAMRYIAGEYYTVNPQAIRTALDVYGENARKIVPIESPVFGTVMAVCVGAMMVGSILTTVDEGDEVKRGQEFGYFKFGGSTIVLLFEKGMVQWDEDLLINGRASLETLVRVGMRVGRAVGKQQPTQ